MLNKFRADATDAVIMLSGSARADDNVPKLMAAVCVLNKLTAVAIAALTTSFGVERRNVDAPPRLIAPVVVVNKFWGADAN